MLAAIDGKVVIENGLCPAHVARQVTRFAVGREAGCHMVRVSSPVVIVRVASKAVRGRIAALVVTSVTVQARMCAS